MKTTKELPFTTEEVILALYGGTIEDLFHPLDKTREYCLIGTHDQYGVVRAIRWSIKWDGSEWSFKNSPTFTTTELPDDNSNFYLSSYILYGVRRLNDCVTITIT